MTRILKDREGGEVRTSETHPISVDFLDRRPWSGKLGVTLAPGKKNASYHEFTWDRDLDADLVRLKNEFGTQVLVTVLMPDEMQWLRIPDLRERVEALGMESLYYPLEDLDAPPEESLGEFVSFLEVILERLDGSKTVVVHCRGGMGRSGMLAACLLALRGETPEDAIGSVRRARGDGAVQMPEQEDMVQSVACYVKGVDT